MNYKKNSSLFFLKGQVVRSGTSVAANSNAACRARSTREYLSKRRIIAEEYDKTLFRIGFISKASFFSDDKIIALQKEATELRRVFSGARKTLKNRFSQ